jgi:YD repeat-containing protein
MCWCRSPPEDQVRTKVLLFLLVLALPVMKMAAQQDTNRGFNPNGMYATGDIDTVNVFNGNLIVNIPLSPNAYPLNGGFSYGLHLIYTGNPWDFVPDLTPPANGGLKDPVPNRRSNAGLGWRVTMGQMRIPGGPLSGTGYSYEPPDGSKHVFFPTLHPNETADPNVQYTRDGTYLRLTVSSSRLDLAFPNGVVHSFDPSTGLLESIRTPFDAPTAPSVTIAHITDPSQCPNGADACWKITDTMAPSVPAGRTQWVTFKHDDNMPPDYLRADKIILAGLTSGSTNQLTYQLNYSGNGDTSLATDAPTCYTFGPGTSPSYFVPLLSSISLPDGTSYSFDYFVDPAQCSQGSLKTLTLPTAGTIAYTYQNYKDAIGSYQALSIPGIRTRVRDGQTWTYTVAATDQGVFPLSDKNRDPDHPSPWAPPLDCSTSDSEFRELTVSIARPDGSSEKNYFSTARRDSQFYCDGSRDEPWLGIEYGLPITHRTGTSYTSMGGQRYLSSQTFSRTGDPLRSSYLTYENDGDPNSGATDAGRRVLGSLTLFADDGGKYIDTANSSFDGLGHYRQSVVADWGLGSLKRTTFTDYNDAQGVYQQGNPGGFTMLSASSPWTLDTFAYQQTSEADKIARNDTCFTNGAVTRTRVRASLTGATGPADVINAYDVDATGNRTKESVYGGDVQVVGTSADPCSMALPSTAAYEVRHGYAYGVRKSSDYYNGGNPFLNVLNLTLDPSGVVTSETDAAGLVTHYSYDSANRLISVTHPGVATKTYTYTAPVVSPAFVGAKVTETQGELVNTFTYDAIGRLASEGRQIPLAGTGVSTVTRATSYDAFDRRQKVYDWVSSGTGPETDFAYDTFGRLTSLTTPDGKSTQYTYAGTAHGGISSMTRTSEIATSLTGAQNICVTENYDSFGRLASVVQKSGPTSSNSVIGSDVASTYTYDLANRLTAVKMGADSGAVQNRIFDYDNRGFLRWESQPESGVTSYQYDARGHLTSKLQSAANSKFDLTYTYDAAERPLSVSGRDPSSPSVFRPLKGFTYGTDNGNGSNYRIGKLVQATRYNYGEVDMYPPDPEYIVDDVYDYTDPAGRRSTRTTTLKEVDPVTRAISTLQQFTMSETYNDLGLPATMTYPICAGCGMPPTDPDRHLMTRTYSLGRLKSLTDYDSLLGTSGYVSDIGYWPNGMRNTIVHWAAPGGHNISDIQAVTNMPRPDSLDFAFYDQCVHPTFVTQPMSVPVSSDGSAQLSALASGTAPITYEWYSEGNGTIIETGQTIPVRPASTTNYYVMARNACGYETSQTAKVSVGECPAPSTGQIDAVLQPDGSWILKPNTIARLTNRSFQWTRLSDNASVGTSETLAIRSLTTTTTYRLTITDSCGTGSGDVTITIPLPVTTGLTATWVSISGYISVTWPTISGATQYTVERRSGGDWQFLANTGTATFYHDTAIAAGVTYAYRVTSDNGGRTDYDVATTSVFVLAVHDQPVSAAVFNDMLRATNLVRAAVGWPPLQWSNILSASDPLPAPDNAITSRQVLSCRARMNEALQALGVTVHDYAYPDLFNVAISSTSINEVIQRAQ